MQHENQDDETTMGENDLRIIATKPTSSYITSTVTDDNEHVNGSQELTEEEIEEFIKKWAGCSIWRQQCTNQQQVHPIAIDGI